MLPMTTVLISRTLNRTDPLGNQSQCIINFGTPDINPNLSNANQTMYYCPIQLAGFYTDYVFALSGEDPLEALIAALIFAGGLLSNCQYKDQFDEWDSTTRFGFPVWPDFNLPPDDGGTGSGDGEPGSGGAGGTGGAGGAG